MAPHFSVNLSCCFTGPRPEKLPWSYNEHDSRCISLKNRISDTIEAVYNSGIRHFICGMAKGCDMYFAEAVIALRDDLPGITLEAAIPCDTQSSAWSPNLKARYNYIVHQCDTETILQHEYTSDCMLLRNMYMVNNSSLLIAVYGGTGGGTLHTINYAIKQGINVIQLKP